MVKEHTKSSFWTYSRQDISSYGNGAYNFATSTKIVVVIDLILGTDREKEKTGEMASFLLLTRLYQLNLVVATFKIIISQ
jgi:hypothetical protein